MKQLVFVTLLSCFSWFIVSSQNHVPVAVNDTVYAFLDYPFQVNLLKNDYDPDGDTIYIWKALGFTQIDDTTWEFTAGSDRYGGKYQSVISVYYIIKDQNGAPGKGYLVVYLKAQDTYDYLDINNMKALISSHGNHFWDSDSSRFEIPKGSGKTTTFNHCIAVGGLTDDGRLHFAGERFRQNGYDFYTGPISDTYDSTYMLKWYRVWKLDRNQINYHINNWSKPGYKPIDVIDSWPARGDVALGQSDQIAPFKDLDNDGQYEPGSGEYPIIRGDQAVFFIINDAWKIHDESYGERIGLEIHGMAYAYFAPEDSILNNTIFFHCDLLNRSDTTYQNSYIGLFNFFSLGSPNDDFTGCDVTNGLAYSYNAYAQDGTGGPYTYGEHPPAFGMKIIGGPFLEPDGIDNPANQCDESLNGLNFGDGHMDNERLGMTSFQAEWCTDESGLMAPKYYNLIQGFRGDNQYHKFGGRLKPSLFFDICLQDSVGPDCRFIFPGNSDTLCNYGTFGIPPNSGFYHNDPVWTEGKVGNWPGYRTVLGSTGPFTFHAGESVPLDYCFTWARDYNGDNISSLELLRNRIATLKPEWNRLIQLPRTLTDIEEPEKATTFQVYPNPVQHKATIRIEGNTPVKYSLFFMTGNRVQEGSLSPGNNLVDFTDLPTGIYVLKCGTSIAKLIHIR